MKIVIKYRDGSFCLALEVGDEVILRKDYTIYDLHYHPAKVIPAGSVVTVVGIGHTYPCSPNWHTCKYTVEDNDGARAYGQYHSAFDFSGVDTNELEQLCI